MDWRKTIKKYRRRGRFLLGAKKVGASVVEQKREYAILVKSIKHYLTGGRK